MRSTLADIKGTSATLAALPDRLRLPFAFAPDRLSSDLARLDGEQWTRHFITDRYDGDWDVLALRAPAGATHPVLMISPNPAARDFVDTPALARCPYFCDVLAAFPCEILGVRLLRLTPGSRIREHTDHESTALDGILRIHLAVTTNPQVEFLLNGTRVPMDAGSAWVLRLCDPHSVANRGNVDRVHMIVDTVMNGPLEDLLNCAMR